MRWLVLRSPAGVLTADEAYTGIQSFEILGGQFPIVLGGTAYTLPFEAYLYAPVAAIVGTNVVLLKLLSTASWALASAVLFLVGSRLAGRRVGLIAASLCWLTPGALLLISVTAYSAYASGMLVTIAAWYVASLVVDADVPNRWLMVGFGVLAGFGFWLHPMFLATLVPMVLVVLWTHRRRLDAWVAVVGGGLLGCAPLLLWNAKNAWPSLDTPAEVEGTYLERLRTFGEDLIPRAFGLRDLGARLAAERRGRDPAVPRRRRAHDLRRGGRRSATRPPQPAAPACRPDRRVPDHGRVREPDLRRRRSLRDHLVPVHRRRDGSGHRLDRGSDVDGARHQRRASWSRSSGSRGFIVPTVEPLVDATSGSPNAHLEDAVAALEDAGIDRIYGSYWAVLPVEFTGDRDIVGGVFPFWPIRFPDRQRTVESTPIDDVAIVYLTSDEDPAQLPLPVDEYDRQVFGDIVLYLPRAADASVSADD